LLQGATTPPDPLLVSSSAPFLLSIQILAARPRFARRRARAGLLNPHLYRAETQEMNNSPPRYKRLLTAAALVSTIVAAAQPHAGAVDIDTLRSQAQALADDVGRLEHRLQKLRTDGTALRRKVAATNRQIAALELRRHTSELEYRRAMDDYIDRAVDVYKSPSPAEGLAIVLSARDFGDAVALAKVTSSSAEAARESLVTLQAARDRAGTIQAQLDVRKEALLSDLARIDRVTAEIQDTLAQRRATLAGINEKIKRLEAQARRAARKAEKEAAGLESLISPGGPSPDVPEGFAPTGVAFEGIASWYGPGFEGNITANGDVFDPGLFTAASRDLPLGSWLHVQHEGKGVVVYVNDRGPFIQERVLDLSQAAAEAIGITGLGWVRAEILVKL
jgi:rare lipoprotein A